LDTFSRTAFMIEPSASAICEGRCSVRGNVPVFKHLPSLFALTLLSLLSMRPVGAQESPKNSLPAVSPSPASVQQAIVMAGNGRCAQALPTLKRGLTRITEKELRYHAEMAIVRCAMAVDDEEAAVDTLLRLRRESPGDPEVLYISTHYFSELGIRASHDLETQAPSSFQAHKLQAEALESQDKNDEAAAIYNKILEENPKTPGIHYRLGQIALAKAGDTGPTADAKKEFESETEIDPLNASAHFVLGELARRSNEWEEATRQFAQAAKLDVGFSEAYLGLGMSLAASGKYADAVHPLESYVKMQPLDPAGHYQLAIAYSHSGNQAGAAREMALQSQAAKNAQSATDNAQGHSVHP
jgi:tetratricopeptide (TPR) repeat protein